MPKVPVNRTKIFNEAPWKTDRLVSLVLIPGSWTSLHWTFNSEIEYIFFLNPCIPAMWFFFFCLKLASWPISAGTEQMQMKHMVLITNLHGRKKGNTCLSNVICDEQTLRNVTAKYFVFLRCLLGFRPIVFYRVIQEE